MRHNGVVQIEIDYTLADRKVCNNVLGYNEISFLQEECLPTSKQQWRESRGRQEVVATVAATAPHASRRAALL